jgi:predicted RNA-binding Zn ribbon-like protein
VVSKPRFKFIAGTLCLDFINTVGGRVACDSSGGSRYCVLNDKLSGFEDLVQWGEAAGLLGRLGAQKMARRSASRRVDAQKAFDRAIALREALYSVCDCLLETNPPAPSDVAVLNRELAYAHTHKCLTFRDETFAWSWDEPASFDRILWAVVDSAAEFLTSSALASLRRCPGDDCGWLFLDASRNGSRQWCEMRICGNRAKLRRFRERMQTHRSAGPAR